MTDVSAARGSDEANTADVGEVHLPSTAADAHAHPVVCELEGDVSSEQSARAGPSNHEPSKACKRHDGEGEKRPRSDRHEGDQQTEHEGGRTERAQLDGSSCVDWVGVPAFDGVVVHAAQMEPVAAETCLPEV